MKRILILFVLVLLTFAVSGSVMAYTVTVAASYPTAVNIYDSFTEPDTLLSSGANAGVTGPVLVRLASDDTLMARYTLNQDLDLTNAGYDYAEDVLFDTGHTADFTFLDEVDYNDMALKETIFPYSNASNFQVCNEKGHSVTDTTCVEQTNIFSFDLTEIEEGTTKTQNTNSITAEVKNIDGTNYVVASGDVDMIVCYPAASLCVLAGTKIAMADGSYKNVEDVEKGDLVISYDEETGQNVVDAVLEKLESPRVTYLVINNELELADYHVLLVNGEWIEAGDAKVGDILRGINGEDIVINSIEVVEVENPVKAYDLRIEKTNNYYADGLLVHNEGSGCYETFNGPPPVPEFSTIVILLALLAVSLAMGYLIMRKKQ